MMLFLKSEKAREPVMFKSCVNIPFSPTEIYISTCSNKHYNIFMLFTK